MGSPLLVTANECKSEISLALCPNVVIIPRLNFSHTQCSLFGNYRMTFEGENFEFANSVVFWLFAKVSPRNLGAWHPLVQQKQAIRESFLHKNCIFHQFSKVFSNVFHYTIESGHIHWENWGLIIKTCHCNNQISLLSKLHLLTSDNKIKTYNYRLG